jgi:hypothetical protein
MNAKRTSGSNSTVIASAVTTTVAVTLVLSATALCDKIQ